MDPKRLVLAIVLSAAVMIGWMKFVSPRFTPKTPVNTQQTESTETKTVTAQNKVSVSDIKPVKSVTKETSISFENEKYTITFSNKGGAIEKFVYKGLKGKEVELAIRNKKLNTSGIFNFSMYFSDNEFLNGNTLENSLWNYSRSEDNIIFSTDFEINGKRVKLQKTYTFLKDENYFKISYNIINAGRDTVILPNEEVIISPSDFIGPEMNFENKYNILSSIIYKDGKSETIHKGSGLFSKSGELKKESGSVTWAGLMGRYFLLLMLPEDGSGSEAIIDNREHTGYKTGITFPTRGIQPGEKFVKSFKVYAGEKNKNKLIAIEPTLVKATDVSMLGVIVEPLKDFVTWSVMKINILVNNFGWSLVIFAILTKILLMPLYLKSMKSMKKMQELTPKINELKEKYKNKPEMLNKETMKLYKTHKVNPVGGCLPMLLQMPFFIALYSALSNSVEMWNAPFIFWIKDLSMPDTVAQISGFNINILPLIMVVSQLLQQKLTPMGAAGQQQKMMTYMMPLVFIFIFWSMPSGLVLYWTVQNLVQMGQQLLTNMMKGKEANA